MPNTGEHAAYTPAPGPQLQLPSLGTLISLVSLVLTLLGGYGNYKVMSAEVDRQHADIVGVQQRLEKLSEAQTLSNIRQQRSEDNYANILSTLTEMKADIRRLRSPNYVDRGTP